MTNVYNTKEHTFMVLCTTVTKLPYKFGFIMYLEHKE